MKSIIFIAPPAAGKGTQSKLISDKYNIPHISTGDLLRNAALENTTQGNYISKQINRGLFVEDEVIFDLLKSRLLKSDCNNGYILDGFPRNVSQAIKYEQLLSNLNKKTGCVILLDLDPEVARKRIVGRVSCPKCGKVYNQMIDELRPTNDKCQDCGSCLIKRKDDNEETFKVRFDSYVKQTIPLIDFYMEKGNLYRIDSNQSKDKIFSEIEKIISGD